MIVPWASLSRWSLSGELACQAGGVGRECRLGGAVGSQLGCKGLNRCREWGGRTQWVCWGIQSGGYPEERGCRWGPRIQCPGQRWTSEGETHGTGLGGRFLK